MHGSSVLGGVAGFDLDIIEDGLVGAVRDHVGDSKQHIVDALPLATQNMEFHADLVLPYRDELQSIPMHGQFVLVQLERDDRPIPDELRDQYLKYRVDIRVLDVERLAGDKLIFVPSHRRLPRFEASHLVSRRTFVFTRAGFGKSNLIKLLFSNRFE